MPQQVLMHIEICIKTCSSHQIYSSFPSVKVKVDAKEERAALVRRGNLGRLGMLAPSPCLQWQWLSAGLALLPAPRAHAAERRRLQSAAA